MIRMYGNKLVLLVVLVVVLGFCTWAARLFISTWYMQLPSIPECVDRRQVKHTFAENPEAYYSCAEKRGELFLSVDYSESKDASKAFLTLLVAVLVASITFSEKIVDVRQSTWTARSVMILSWVSFLLAIGSCGAAMALMILAAGYASHFPWADFGVLEHRAGILYLFSGLAFGIGLAALLVAGVISMASRSAGSSVGK